MDHMLYDAPPDVKKSRVYRNVSKNVEKVVTPLHLWNPCTNIQMFEYIYNYYTINQSINQVIRGITVFHKSWNKVLNRGDEVWVNYQDDGNFFRANILQKTSNGMFTVRYNDNDVECEVPRKRIMVRNPNPDPQHYR